jgi:probable HAF family extracellular repeat protein
MKLNWTIIALATLAVTLPMSAQDNPNHKPKHHQYKLYDVGTFGGPNSSLFVDVPNLNSNGTFVGLADTASPDPYYPYCFASILDLNLEFNTGLGPDCHVTHAYKLGRNGAIDLGSLPEGGSSAATAISDSDIVAGVSENGSIDPLTGYPQIRAVAWKESHITDLGTFGGNVSASFAVNSRGDVVGSATNTIPDQFASFLGPCFWNGSFCWPVTSQLRAFLWRDGAMQDLGTLGGNDAYAAFINDSGEITGASFTSTVPNQDTGVPTVDPFLWKNGKMIDLGGLGGTIGFPYWLNNRGQVVGSSALPGDQTSHAFLWDRGVLSDLGPSGGTCGTPLYINDDGDVAGFACFPGEQAFHAFLWSHGQMTDIGALPAYPCSGADAVNARGQVVGVSQLCQGGQAAAFLWENGGPMVDLNALLEDPYNGHLYWAININARGEIAVLGMVPGGGIHAYLMVPDGDCDDDCEQRVAASQNAQVMPPATAGAAFPAFGKPADWLHIPFGKRVPMPARPTAPSN